MKVTQDLALKQSLTMTHDMRLAIDMLSMNTLEIDRLVDEELEKNPCLEEDSDAYFERPSSFFDRDASSSYDVALATIASTMDFRETLMRQVGLKRFNVLERFIAEMIINNLDDDGLFADHELVEAMIMDEFGIFPEWIDSVRLRIMDLEPLGCAAKSVKETLQHQVKFLSFPHEKFLLLLDEVGELATPKYAFALLNKIRGDGKLQELRKLNPRPASPINDHDYHHQVFPDAIVEKSNNGLLVSLLKRPSRRLLVKNGAQRLAGEHGFVREQRKRANFLVRSLQFRENNLLLVTQAIVSHQEAWFLGNEELKPLSLSMVAEKCGLHESSISRLVNGKFLVCSRGFFELKYFFGQAVMANNSDEGMSARTIKDHIKAIVHKENKGAPWSDQKIVELLEKQGISISRRTVTKYRESLKIASTIERRSLVAKAALDS